MHHVDKYDFLCYQVGAICSYHSVMHVHIETPNENILIITVFRHSKNTGLKRAEEVS
jgi:hypothetical protein